jgi:osmotically-inducible protein OsmY
LPGKEIQVVSFSRSADDVHLNGTVRTWAERQEAQRPACWAPGVTSVQNNIVISG